MPLDEKTRAYINQKAYMLNELGHLTKRGLRILYTLYIFTPILCLLLFALGFGSGMIFMRQGQRQLQHSNDLLSTANKVIMDACDAETGQRGYLLTNDWTYLEPYAVGSDAVRRDITRLRELLLHAPEETALLDELQSAADVKLTELKKTIDLSIAGHRDQAMAIVIGNTGKMQMLRIRELAARLQTDELKRISNKSATSVQ